MSDETNQPQQHTSAEDPADEHNQDNGLRGVAEEVKGRAKEAFGALAGDEQRKHEGATQQEKAQAQQEAAEAETRAEQARHEAAERERQQRANQ